MFTAVEKRVSLPTNHREPIPLNVLDRSLRFQLSVMQQQTFNHDTAIRKMRVSTEGKEGYKRRRNYLAKGEIIGNAD